MKKSLKNWFGLKCKLRFCKFKPKYNWEGSWGECVECKRTDYYEPYKVDKVDRTRIFK